ncbi:hypothetical protein L195_g011356 [Trifolium pratense]|uniref:Uncharacterized protein n=2 Tax=Trifolium TaxID=3898 RepID=A0A2K3PHA6_TRIPR|nr:hypothetical protein L195_g011356 [Trifolium pratense]
MVGREDHNKSTNVKNEDGNHRFNPFSKLLVSELVLQDAAESARKAEASRKRAEDIAAGTVQMNGRELFLHEPWVFDDSRF